MGPVHLPHQCAIDQLFVELASSPQGLMQDEAKTRLSRDGANVLVARRKTPLPLAFLRQFRNLFAVLLIAGGGLALLGERLDPRQGNLYIACALFSVVFLNAIFTFVQEYQSDRILKTFERMLAPQATVLRDGRPVVIAASEIVRGDVLVLTEGEGVAADARLFEANGLNVDSSSLTGESDSSPRVLDCTHEDVLQSRNMVFSGTLVHSGTGKALVCSTGMATQIGGIVRLTKETAQIEAPIRREIEHFVRVISTIAVVLGVVFFSIGTIAGKGVITSLIFAIGIIVANVPEGLLPTVTLSLTMASKRMAKRNALVRHLESVETLGCATVICTDKTGTLTQNRMRVTTVVLDGDEYSGWDPLVRNSPSFESFRRIETLCNNATWTESGCMGDSTETALLLHAHDLEAEQTHPAPKRIVEEPFDSESRCMTTVYELGTENVRALLKGAPEVVLDKCSQWLDRGTPQPLGAPQRAHLVSQFARLARRGERVLALAEKKTTSSSIPRGDFVFVGIVGLTDPPRPGVEVAMARCRSAGIRVLMITGDHALTAESVARQIGLVRGYCRVVTGDELRALPAGGLATALEADNVLFARTSPSQKLRIVKALQARGEIVAVTGDGVNDAPALKNADIGVAMGSGTEVAREAAKIVLLDDNFATIVSAIEEGRTIFANIRKFIAYILASNIPEILPFIAYVLLDIPLPLTVALILAIDLGTDILPALGLGAEQPESDVMRQSPRPRQERLLSRNLLFMSYAVVGTVQAAAGFFSFFFVLHDGGWSYGEALEPRDPLYRTAVTSFFASVVVCQIADVMICRTRHQSLFTIGLLSNRLVLLGIFVELALLSALSYVPMLNVVFGTAPLEWWHIALSIPFALFILVADELRRFLVRKQVAPVLRYLTW